MNIQEIANKLVSCCREGRYDTVYSELYSPDIRSVEPIGDNPEVQGLDAIRSKGEYWNENFEIHGGKVGDPSVNGNQILVYMEMDTTNKHTQERSTMKEYALYTVEGGKIVEERFFYL